MEMEEIKDLGRFFGVFFFFSLNEILPAASPLPPLDFFFQMRVSPPPSAHSYKTLSRPPPSLPLFYPWPLVGLRSVADSSSARSTVFTHPFFCIRGKTSLPFPPRPTIKSPSPLLMARERPFFVGGVWFLYFQRVCQWSTTPLLAQDVLPAIQAISVFFFRMAPPPVFKVPFPLVCD